MARNNVVRCGCSLCMGVCNGRKADVVLMSMLVCAGGESCQLSITRESDGFSIPVKIDRFFIIKFP